MTSILLCSTPRSGSWLLAEGVESIGSAGHPQEYFRADYEAIYRETWGLAPGSDYGTYLAGVCDRAGTPDGTISVKFHWRQFTHFLGRAGTLPHLQNLQQDKLVAAVFAQPVYVFLRRRDKAAQAVSLYRAMLSDNWWQFETGTRGIHASLHSHRVDFSRIAAAEADLAEDEAAWLGYFAAFGITPIAVTYEGLAQDYRATLSSVVAALAIHLPEGFAPAEPRLHKQADALSARWLDAYLAWKENATVVQHHAI